MIRKLEPLKRRRGLILAVICLAALVAALIAFPCFRQDAGWAAWVQATGSIVGIGVAVVIARDTQQAAQRDRQSLHRRELENARTAAQFAYDTVREVEHFGNSIDMDTNQFKQTYRPAAFDAALRLIKSVPLSMIEDLDTREVFFRLEAELATLKARLDDRIAWTHRHEGALRTTVENALINTTKIFNAAAGAERGLARALKDTVRDWASS